MKEINYAELFAKNKSKIAKMNAKVEATVVKSKIDKLEKTDLWTLKWVWWSTVKLLLENWISSLAELREADISSIELNPFSLKAINEFLQTAD